MQNFRAVPGVPMEHAPEPDDDEVTLAVAMARLILDADVSLQAPPNLNPASAEALLASGLNDFGGISPVTPDYINPRHPWPHLDALGDGVRARRLRPAPARLDLRSLRRAARLPRSAPRSRPTRAVAGAARRAQRRSAARREPASLDASSEPVPGDVRRVLERALDGRELGVDDAVRPVRRARALAARARRRGRSPPPRAGRRRGRLRRQPQRQLHQRVRQGVPLLRLLAHPAQRGGLLPRRSRRSCGARSRPRRSARPRSASRRASRPGIDARFYIDLVRALKAAAPALHVHALSPEEVKFAATESGWSFRRVLEEMKDAGLGSLPGTSAEVLDDARARADRARAHHDGRVGRGRDDGPRDRPAARRRRSCTATSRPTWSGCGTSICCARSSARPAASPSSCRCRSCTKRRR